MGAKRIAELDLLRGFALLGVFIVHFVGAAYYDLPVPKSIIENWKQEPLQYVTVFFSDWLFHNKANTLFATLFGMGFWVMLQRFRERAENFSLLYKRRLLGLFVIGLANLFLVFPIDVLHEYALIGLVLFMIRNWSKQTMLIAGLILTFTGQPLGDYLAQLIITSEKPESDFKAVFALASYSAWLAWFPSHHIATELGRLELVGWSLYILGRFLLGVWIIRMGWLNNLAEKLPKVRVVAKVGLLFGVVIELVGMLIWQKVIQAPEWIASLLHEIGAPLLALGFAAGLILLFHKRHYWVAWLAPVGRVALTAYIIHGVLFTLLFFPMAFNLIGIVTPFGGLLISIALFIVLSLGATIWLRHFRYGPFEFLWRWFTYGSKPSYFRNKAKGRI